MRFGIRSGGRRVEAKRIPSKRRPSNNSCWQTSINCCVACGAHSWFLTLFFGYILVSSLPRILTVLDFLITLSLYLSIENGIDSFENISINSMKEFSFDHSTIDVVCISFIRSIILFICFAYRYQREGFKKNLYYAFSCVLLSTIYLISKLFYLHSNIIVFSLFFVYIECIFFLLVRRRRIRFADPNTTIVSKDTSSKNAIGNRYHQIHSGDNNIKIIKSKNSDRQTMVFSHESLIENERSKQQILIDTSSDKLCVHHTSDTTSYQAICSSPALCGTSYDDDGKAETMDILISTHPPLPIPMIVDTYLDDIIHNTSVEKIHSNLNQHHTFDDHSSLLREQSISVVMPVSEFDILELPLKTEHSAFFIIDGIVVHYCLEWNSMNMNRERSPNPNQEQKNEDIENTDDLPFIILLHGFGGGVFSWKRCWKLLLPNTCGILAFDRVGFGLTERPLYSTNESNDENVSNQPTITTDDTINNPYGILFSLHILQIFMDKFNLQKRKCILIGHSTGASIANWFTILYPKYSIHSLLLISPTTGMPSFIRSILKTKLGKSIIMSLVRSEIANVTLHQAWNDPQQVPSYVINAYRSVLKLKNWNESLLEMARVKPITKHKHEYFQRLKSIRCPVWIIHGSDDRLVHIRESQQLLGYFKCAKLIMIENGGHMPHEEMPKIFVRNVMHILNKDYNACALKLKVILDEELLMKGRVKERKGSESILSSVSKYSKNKLNSLLRKTSFSSHKSDTKKKRKRTYIESVDDEETLDTDSRILIQSNDRNMNVKN